MASCFLGTRHDRKAQPMHAHIIPPPIYNPGDSTLLVSGEETGGRLAVVRIHCLGGIEPPLRRHHREDVVVHVVRGELAFTVEGTTHALLAGATVHVPSGCEHGYTVRSATADLLVFLTPAGAETCLGDLWAGADHPSPDAVERMVIAAAHHGIEITGPAPTPT
jgi:quercetin dioxygenase-like cupin family protein